MQLTNEYMAEVRGVFRTANYIFSVDPTKQQTVIELSDACRLQNFISASPRKVPLILNTGTMARNKYMVLVSSGNIFPLAKNIEPLTVLY